PMAGLDLRPHRDDLDDLFAAVLPNRPAALAPLATGALVRDRLPGLRGGWQRPVARTPTAPAGACSGAQPGGVPAPGQATVRAVHWLGWAVLARRDRWGHRRAGGAISTVP